MNEWNASEWRVTVYTLVRDAGSYGRTWAEIAEETGRHHGTVSGALSMLHKNGDVARLSERRGGRKVYVHPHFVDGRTVEPQGVNRVCPHCGGDL